MNARMSLIYRIWWYALPIKLLLAVLIPLSNDEAYYWVWSQHLQLSYFDHPPFIAWLFWLGQPLEGLLSAPRIPGVLLGHATLLLWIEILKPSLNEKQLFWWLVIMLVSPLMGLGSLMMTPDLPLIFWWSAALLLFLRACRNPQPHRLFYLGAALGMGFCSKYHVVLFFPAALLSLWSTRRLRLLTPLAFASVSAGFLLASTPVWLWNLQNDFISFTFQLNHGLGAESWNPMWTVEYLAGQVLLLLPVVVYYALQRKPPSDMTSTLRWFAWLPLAFFALTSFKGRVEANWTMVAYPSVLALAVQYRADLTWIRRAFQTFAVATAVVLVCIAAYPMMPDTAAFTKLKELYKYQDMADEVRQVDEVYTTSYQTAAQLSYLTGRPIHKLSGVGRTDFYDFLPEANPQTDRYHVVIRNDRDFSEAAQRSGFRITNRRALTPGFDLADYERTRVAGAEPRAIH